jgi:hypothetical protein
VMPPINTPPKTRMSLVLRRIGMEPARASFAANFARPSKIPELLQLIDNRPSAPASRVCGLLPTTA